MSESKTARSRRPRAANARNRSHIVAIDRGIMQQELACVQSRRTGAPQPRPIDDNPVHQRRFRFRRSTTGQAVVTTSSLFNLLFVATGSSTAKRLFGAVRLVAVELWTSIAANTNGTNVSQLTFFSTIGGDDFDQSPPQVFEALSSGTSRPGHLRVRPGLLTKAAHWMDAQAAAVTPSYVFTEDGQPGDIVEVTIEYTLADLTVNGTLFSIVGGSLTAGAIYSNNLLDNTSTGGGAGTGVLGATSGFNTGLGQG